MLFILYRYTYFHVRSISLYLKNSLNIYFNVCMWWYRFQLFYVKKSILPSFIKDTCTWYKILCWQDVLVLQTHRSESFHCIFWSETTLIFHFILFISTYLLEHFECIHNQILYCCSITVVPISPHCSPLPHPPPAPTVNPHPVVHVHGLFILVL